jgi:Flp pilus assembly protein TadD
MKAKSEEAGALWPKCLQVVAWTAVWAYAVGLGYITLLSRAPTESPITFQDQPVKEAISHLQEALQFRPDDPEILNTMGAALEKEGRRQEAIMCYEHAIRVAPNDSKAYNNLGLVLISMDEDAEAIQSFEHALRVNPNDNFAGTNLGKAANNLAWTLATKNIDTVRAVTLARRACNLTGNRAVPCLDTLAVAYAANGQFDEAIGTIQGAIGLAQSNKQTELIGELNTHLVLFRNGRAYREPATAPTADRP